MLQNVHTHAHTHADAHVHVKQMHQSNYKLSSCMHTNTLVHRRIHPRTHTQTHVQRKIHHYTRGDYFVKVTAGTATSAKRETEAMSQGGKRGSDRTGE